MDTDLLGVREIHFGKQVDHHCFESQSWIIRLEESNMAQLNQEARQQAQKKRPKDVEVSEAEMDQILEADTTTAIELAMVNCKEPMVVGIFGVDLLSRPSQGQFGAIHAVQFNSELQTMALSDLPLDMLNYLLQLVYESTNTPVVQMWCLQSMADLMRRRRLFKWPKLARDIDSEVTPSFPSIPPSLDSSQFCGALSRLARCQDTTSKSCRGNFVSTLSWFLFEYQRASRIILSNDLVFAVMEAAINFVQLPLSEQGQEVDPSHPPLFVALDLVSDWAKHPPDEVLITKCVDLITPLLRWTEGDATKRGLDHWLLKSHCYQALAACFFMKPPTTNKSFNDNGKQSQSSTRYANSSLESSSRSHTSPESVLSESHSRSPLVSSAGGPRESTPSNVVTSSSPQATDNGSLALNASSSSAETPASSTPTLHPLGSRQTQFSGHWLKELRVVTFTTALQDMNQYNSFVRNSMPTNAKNCCHWNLRLLDSLAFTHDQSYAAERRQIFQAEAEKSGFYEWIVPRSLDFEDRRLNAAAIKAFVTISNTAIAPRREGQTPTKVEAGIKPPSGVGMAIQSHLLISRIFSPWLPFQQDQSLAKLHGWFMSSEALRASVLGLHEDANYYKLKRQLASLPPSESLVSFLQQVKFNPYSLHCIEQVADLLLAPLHSTQYRELHLGWLSQILDFSASHSAPSSLPPLDQVEIPNISAHLNSRPRAGLLLGQCAQFMHELLPSVSLGDCLSAVSLQGWRFPRSPTLEELINAADQFRCQTQSPTLVEAWRCAETPSPSPASLFERFSLPVPLVVRRRASLRPDPSMEDLADVVSRWLGRA